MADNRHKLRCAGGKFQKLNNSNGRKRRKCNSNIVIEHNYATCNNSSEESAPKLGKSVSKDGWREGRRVWCFAGTVEILPILSVGAGAPYFLQCCRRAAEGARWVRCQNHDCGEVNCVPYGKTYRQKSGKGMPCFAVNTKLGTGVYNIYSFLSSR